MVEAIEAGDSITQPSQNLAYEIDEISRIITVVYIGVLTDADVLAFYRSLVQHRPDAPDYDFLLDLRYTAWSAQADTIIEIEALFDVAARDTGRRIAVVRKGTAIVFEQVKSELVRQGIGDRTIRYFDSLNMAQDWLTGRRRI